MSNSRYQKAWLAAQNTAREQVGLPRLVPKVFVCKHCKKAMVSELASRFYCYACKHSIFDHSGAESGYYRSHLRKSTRPQREATDDNC